MSPTLRAAFYMLLLPLLGRPLAGAQWLKLETKDVVIYSDAPRSEVVEFAVGYSAFRHVYHQMFAPPRQTPPAVVLLFRDLGELQENLPPPSHKNSQSISFTTDVDGVALLALAVDGDRELALQQTIQFDTIFQLERLGVYVPLWMSQGAGQVLGKMRVKKNSCIVGDEYSDYDERWHWSGSLSWNRFFEVTTSSAEYAGPKSEGLFHAKAWALMHRILLGSQEPSQVFQGLVAKVQTMGDAEAVQSVVGVPIERIDEEISRHLKKFRSREIPFPADAIRKSVVVENAPEEEVHVQLSNLLFATKKPDQGELELAKAQMIAPASAVVIEARARSAMREKEPGEAVRLYREAIAKGSTNAMAYQRSAEQRMSDITGGADRPGGGGAAVAESVAEIRKALEIDPSSGRAYVLLGRALFLTPDLKPEHVDELSRGVSRGPMGESARLYRAFLNQRLGRNDEYLSDLKQIRDDPLASEGTRALAIERLDKAEIAPVVADVERLAKEGSYDEARATLTRALVSSSSRVATERLRSLSFWVDESEAYAAVRAAVQAKDWAKVTETGGKFLRDYPRSNVASSVRRALDQAARATRSGSVPSSKRP